MKRVLPDEPITDGGPLDARLDELLGQWATWMHTGTYGTGYPGRSPGLLSGKSSIDDQVRDMQLRLARAMDAMIDSLAPNERLALLRFYGLTADVWRLREPWDVLEAKARRSLRAMMKARRIE